jgi:hypothetical protein
MARKRLPSPPVRSQKWASWLVVSIVVPDFEAAMNRQRAEVDLGLDPGDRRRVGGVEDPQVEAPVGLPEGLPEDLGEEARAAHAPSPPRAPGRRRRRRRPAPPARGTTAPQLLDDGEPPEAVGDLRRVLLPERVVAVAHPGTAPLATSDGRRLHLLATGPNRSRTMIRSSAGMGRP